ncbi:MAG: hypothetical protein LBQ96_02615 [Fusobacteriaceae bacterium]|jgi:hypothetical protein|nr:hypothetical protein [Fusobacteriaceae bacterium]
MKNKSFDIIPDPTLEDGFTGVYSRARKANEKENPAFITFLKRRAAAIKRYGPDEYLNYFKEKFTGVSFPEKADTNS